jgi:hypothetical protein
MGALLKVKGKALYSSAVKKCRRRFQGQRVKDQNFFSFLRIEKKSRIQNLNPGKLPPVGLII